MLSSSVVGWLTWGQRVDPGSASGGAWWQELTGSGNCVVWRQDVRVWSWAATVKPVVWQVIWTDWSLSFLIFENELYLTGFVIKGPIWGFDVWLLTAFQSHLSLSPAAPHPGKLIRKPGYWGGVPTTEAPPMCCWLHPHLQFPVHAPQAGSFLFSVKPPGIYLGAVWSPQRALLCEQETCSYPAVCVWHFQPSPSNQILSGWPPRLWDIHNRVFGRIKLIECCKSRSTHKCHLFSFFLNFCTHFICSLPNWGS